MKISRVLTSVATALVALIAAAPPAGAAPVAAPAVATTVATPGWYLLVDNLWYPEQPWRCLSANDSTPPGGGAGTHQVYLAVCNPDTQGQWWYLKATNHYDLIENAPMWGGKHWCLSRNNTMPQGGATGEYSVYTAQCNASTSYQSWQSAELSANIITVQNLPATAGNSICLSGKSANPLPGNVWRTFAQKCSYAGPQVFRPWAPTSFVR